MKAIGRRLLVAIAYLIIRFIYFTLRLEEGPYPGISDARIKQKIPTVIGHFHEHDWPLILFHLFRPVVVLVSLSKDGSLLNLFLTKLGFHVARGSSSRGAVSGFRQLLDKAHESGCPLVSLAVDGPRGPRRIAKKGLLKLAQLLDSPVVFANVYTSPAWILKKSWSKAIIPKPFARMKMVYAEMLSIDEVRASLESREKENSTMEILQQRIEKFAAQPILFS